MSSRRDGYGRCASCGLSDDHTSTCRYRPMIFGFPKSQVSYSVETRRKGRKQWKFSHTPNCDAKTEADLIEWIADNPGFEARVTKTRKTVEVSIVK